MPTKVLELLAFFPQPVGQIGGAIEFGPDFVKGNRCDGFYRTTTADFPRPTSTFNHSN
jgi:hypothetical protein